MALTTGKMHVKDGSITECRIFFTNGKFAEKDGVRVRSVFQTCGKFAAECYVTLTIDTVYIDIVYVGTLIGNGVVYGPIYGNM